MKTLSKLQQLSFIIRREFLAISTSYAVLLVLMGGIFVYEESGIAEPVV